MSTPLFRLLGPVLIAGTVLTAPVPAAAQDDVSEARMRKIEAEVRALQRKVFPGGDGRFFEPQMSQGEQAEQASNAPSTTAVTDILARLDAMEAQLQRLTAQVEENTNAIGQLDTRIVALEGTGAAAEPVVEAEQPSAAESNLQAMSGASSQVTAEPAPAATTSQPAGPSDARLAAVQEITKPQTDDPADDEYSYGFRLWNAGFFPEAQQQLSMYVEKYPDHWRMTYGRNLLGRAYLDDGKAREAAPWFLRNYQSDKQAARAPDSLLYLAEAMVALGDTNRACIALAEFSETYPALAAGRLQDQYEGNRRKVSCN